MVKVQGRILVKLKAKFLPNAVRGQFFAWRTKFGEIDPISQMAELAI
jgi:hypothetical protein